MSNRLYCGDLVQNWAETISVTSSKRREAAEEDFLIIKNTHEAIFPKLILKLIVKDSFHLKVEETELERNDRKWVTLKNYEHSLGQDP
jgi:hypothetical protein